MSLANDPAALLAIAGAIAPAFAGGKVPTGQREPYFVLFGGNGLPSDRALCGTTPDRQAVHRLMAVSNNINGCRILTNRLVDAIDGHMHDGAPWLVELVSDPLEDATDPSSIRWTSTVEIHHYTRS